MHNSNQDDKVRSAILNAARSVFQRWGLNKATMEDIAAEASKGKSTLYYYFKTKEELFDAVIMEEFSQALGRARQAALRAVSAREKLKTYISVFIKENKEKISLYAIIRHELRRNFNVLDKLRDRFAPAEISYIKEILVQGIKTHELTFIDESEVNTAAETVVGLIHALELYLLLENDDIRQVDIAAKMIAHGL